MSLCTLRLSVAKRAPNTIHSTLYTTLYTRHTPHSKTLTFYTTLHSTLHTLHSTLYNLQTPHFTVYKLHTPHFTLRTPHFTVSTPLHAPHSTVAILVMFHHFSKLKPFHHTLGDYPLQFTFPLTLHQACAACSHHGKVACIISGWLMFCWLVCMQRPHCRSGPVQVQSDKVDAWKIWSIDVCFALSLDLCVYVYIHIYIFV